MMLLILLLMLLVLLLPASLLGLRGVRTPWDEDTLGIVVVEAVDVGQDLERLFLPG